MKTSFGKIIRKLKEYGVLKTVNRSKFQKDLTELNDEDVEVTILTDEFGDSYMLYKKGVNFDAFKDMDIICLGRDILPLKNMPLVMDEITFEIYEIYDFEYKRLI